MPYLTCSPTYIKQLDGFEGAGLAGTVIVPGEVKRKVLKIVIPPDEYVTLSQLRVIEAATRRANQLGIQVQVLRVR